MIPAPTLITFICYLVCLLGIGLWFYRRQKNLEDYLLGGRGLGAWVTALSAQASDMSGWLLMGLPGAVYLGGLKESWIAIGLFIGTVLNWRFIAARLRTYTKKTDTITLPCFFEGRFRDPTGLLRIVSALIILLFFTIYASSALVAAGKLFESMFEVSYYTAILIGVAVIVAYTFMGGFLAVCWTDMLQGTLMFIAIIVVPTLAYNHVGGWVAMENAMEIKNISTCLIPTENDFPVLAVISALAWGLGYFGQPHILARFMGVKSIKELPRSMAIAIVWVFISLFGAVAVGLISIAKYDGLSGGEEEKVFIYLVGDLFNPWLGGILLAAILSAIMSTIDSQLLVCSSALTEDFYKKTLRRKASEKEVVIIGRMCVIIISLIALVLAWDRESSILKIVAYAWGGFGAAFGPVVIFALFSRKTTWQAALAGMISGTVVLIIWKRAGLSDDLYEIVPGFAVNCLVILLANLIVKQKDETILGEFDEMAGIVKNTRTVNGGE